MGAVTSVALAGCTSADDPVEEGDDPGEVGDDDTTEVDEQVLQSIQIAESSLDPITTAGPASARSKWQMHEQLFTYENGTFPVTGELAEDYDISDDALTYTFELKQGVTFHDGSELTADDVVYSWRRLAESENNSGHEDRIVGGVMSVEHEVDDDENIVPDSLAIEAVDEYTVEMTLETPFHGTLGNLADPRFSIVPEGIVGDIEGYDGEMDYDEFSTERPYGTGPFVLEEWDRGNFIQVERFDDYHGEVAELDGVRWQELEDPNAVYNRAMNQEADIFELPRSQFDPDLLEIEDEDDDGRRYGTYGPVQDDVMLEYADVTSLRTQYLLFNTLEVDRPVRQAIAYLINQENIAEQAVRGQGTPAYFLTPPAAFPGGVEAYDELAESDYPYGYGESDIDAAQQVMEDAGYGPDNRYEVTLEHPSDSQASEWGEIASVLRDQAESAHIDLSVSEAPSTTLTNQAIEGNIEIFATWNELEWAEADATLQFAYPNPFTWTQWGQGDEMSEAAETAAAAWERYEDHRLPNDDDLAVREEAYQTIEEANWEDMTQLPLYHPIYERYAYEWVENLDMFGSQHSQKFNQVSLGDRS